METTEFLEASPGNKSNSRRITWYAFWAGLYDFMTTTATVKPSLAGIAAASITAFVGIAGPAMTFAFGQKSNEVKELNA